MEISEGFFKSRHISTVDWEVNVTMINRHKLLVFLSAIVILLLLAVGCASAPSSVPTPTPEPTPAPEPTPTPTCDWVNNVTRAWVVAHSHNWDADAEDDGIRVWVKLQDKNEDEVRYENIEMPVVIEVYTTESRTLPRKPERLIYSGSSVMRSWDDDAFVTGANGIKDISWEEMSALSTDQAYGIIYVTITLPNGKECAARDDEARIKAHDLN